MMRGKDRYDCAVLVTNDSDMTGAMRLIKKEFYYKRPRLIAPGGRPTAGLKQYTDFTKNIDDGDLAVALFPNPIKRLAASHVFKPPSL